MAEASDGEVSQHAAVEHRPDPFQRVEIRGVGGRLVHPQPGWALAAGRDWAGVGGGGPAIGGSLLNRLFPRISVLVQRYGAGYARLALRGGPGPAEGRMRRGLVIVVLAGAAAHHAGCRGKD